MLSIPDRESIATPSLHLVRDEKPTHDEPATSAAYVTVSPVEVTRTIIGTLGANAYTVYALLDTYCNEAGDAWPSLDRIAAEIANVSQSTIQRCLAKLERDGWVYRTTRTNQFGMTCGITYTLPYHYKSANGRGSQVEVNAKSSRSQIAPPFDQRVNTSNTKVNTKVSIGDDAAVLKSSAKKSVSASEISESFAAFWDAYPKGKGNRKQALAQWDRIKPDAALATTIIAGVERWKRSKRWRDGYIKAAELWLRDRWWDDEIDEVVETMAGGAWAVGNFAELAIALQREGK